MATMVLLGPHPHGGGGGGHHHGGGGHHHHGGGGGRFWQGDGGWYAPDVYVMQPSCPTTLAPVLGTDGMTYQNACYAAVAGVAVAKTLSGPLTSLSPAMRWFVYGALGLAAVAGGLYAYRKLSKRRR